MKRLETGILETMYKSDSIMSFGSKTIKSIFDSILLFILVPWYKTI